MERAILLNIMINLKLLDHLFRYWRNGHAKSNLTKKAENKSAIVVGKKVLPKMFFTNATCSCLYDPNNLLRNCSLEKCAGAGQFFVIEDSLPFFLLSRLCIASNTGILRTTLRITVLEARLCRIFSLLK